MNARNAGNARQRAAPHRAGRTSKARGVPAGTTSVYRAALRFGDAAAMAVLLFAATLTVVALELLVLRRWLRRLR
jgi:hypothetical protein